MFIHSLSYKKYALYLDVFLYIIDIFASFIKNCILVVIILILKTHDFYLLFNLKYKMTVKLMNTKKIYFLGAAFITGRSFGTRKTRTRKTTNC